MRVQGEECRFRAKNARVIRIQGEECACNPMPADSVQVEFIGHALRQTPTGTILSFRFSVFGFRFSVFGFRVSVFRVSDLKKDRESH